MKLDWSNLPLAIFLNITKCNIFLFKMWPDVNILFIISIHKVKVKT